MSPPPAPHVPPEFQPPVSYGGYGGELQNYGQPTGVADLQSGRSPTDVPPAAGPQPGYPPPGALPLNTPQPSAHEASWSPQPGYPSATASSPVTAPWSGPDLPHQTGLVPPQRPAVVGLAVTLAATASLQWICVLGFAWLVATTGARQLGTTGVDGALFHILNRFNYRMLDGLAWPLFLFPLASFVLSFLLLTRRTWTRIAFTATGVAALAWSGWWLRTDLLWWLVPAGYVAVTVLVLWTPDTTRWYRWRPASDPAGQSP